MRQARVMVTTLNGDPASSQQCIARLVHGCPPNEQPKFIDGELDDPPTALALYDALIVLAGQDVPEGHVLDVIEHVVDEAMPVIAIGGSETARHWLTLAGAHVCDAADTADAIRTLLRGMLHGRDAVQRLRDEVHVAQRFQGGLRGQIVKMHEELQLAAMVQREYLPTGLPSKHGVEFGVLYRPSNYVSGDIYDVIPLDDDHIGVFLADAVGHGVPAALMTMVISRSLVVFDDRDQRRIVLEPGEVLTRLNRQMIRRRGDAASRFATAVYAVIDCKNQRMTIAGAGHPPPLLFRTDGSIEMMTTEGALLGIFEDGGYDQMTVDLDLEDRVIMFSDGFEQAFPLPPASDRSGAGVDCRMPTNRYQGEFSVLRQCPTAHAMIEQLQKRLDGQRGSLHQIDDLTSICIRIGPRPRPTTAAADRSTAHPVTNA